MITSMSPGPPEGLEADSASYIHPLLSLIAPMPSQYVFAGELRVERMSKHWWLSGLRRIPEVCEIMPHYQSSLNYIYAMTMQGMGV